MKFDQPVGRAHALQGQALPAAVKELPANPFAKYRGATEKRLRLGPHWVQSPQIQGELEAMKSKVIQMLMTQKKESPKTSLPRFNQFNPPSREIRELHQVTKVEAKESNPRQDVSVLSFDQSSGLLFFSCHCLKMP